MLRAVAVLLVVVMLAPAAAAARHELALGPPWLGETRTTDVLSPGVTYADHA